MPPLSLIESEGYLTDWTAAALFGAAAVVSADMRFERVASTSGVRTHRKNERFSLAADTPILIFEEAPHPFHVWIENTSWTFQEAIAYIRFDDYNYTVIL